MLIQKQWLNQTLSLVPRRARVRAVGERRFPLVCTHAHVPTARRDPGPKRPRAARPRFPHLSEAIKVDIQQRRRQQQQSSTRYIGCITVYIARLPSLVLVVHSSARTDTYLVSNDMYLVYYYRYWCICCVHILLARRRSPAVARPPPVLLVVPSSSTRYRLL